MISSDIHASVLDPHVNVHQSFERELFSDTVFALTGPSVLPSRLLGLHADPPHLQIYAFSNRERTFTNVLCVVI